MTPVNHFVNDCPNFNYLPSFLLHRSSLEVGVQLFHLGLIISTLEISLAIIHRDVLVLTSTLEIALPNVPPDVLVLFNVADVHQCNKVDFPCLLFLCSIVAFASGIMIAWNERSFIHTSRFPEACVSERQVSRVF